MSNSLLNLYYSLACGGRIALRTLSDNGHYQRPYGHERLDNRQIYQGIEVGELSKESAYYRADKLTKTQHDRVQPHDQSSIRRKNKQEAASTALIAERSGKGC